MKTIGLVRLNLVCLGEAAVQLKLKLEDLPQARQGSCALLAVCFFCLPAYAQYRIWVMSFELQLNWECCSVDILLLCCLKSSISGNKATGCLRCGTNL